MTTQETIIDILKKLLSADNFISIDIVPLLSSAGGVTTISGVASFVALITFSILLVKLWINGGLDGVSKTTLVLTDFIVIALFFLLSSGYLYLVTLLQALQHKLFDSTFTMYLQSFNADIGFMLSTIHEQSTNGMNLIDLNPYTTTMDIMLLSASLLALVFLLYALFAVFKLLFAISLFLGPLCAAFSLIFPDIMRHWRNFVLVGLCYPVFTGAGLIAIHQTGILKLVAGNIAVGWMLPASISIVLAIAVIWSMPKIMSVVFDIGFADFTGFIWRLITFFSPLKWLKFAKKK